MTVVSTVVPVAVVNRVVIVQVNLKRNYAAKHISTV